jgi:hypothetical protein
MGLKNVTGVFLMSDKGLLASICSFFKGLFSADADNSKPENKAAAAAKNDGLTGVERYLRSKGENGGNLTGVERYIRNQLSNNKPLTGVEKYIRSNTQSKPVTGVEKYIRSKA